MWGKAAHKKKRERLWALIFVMRTFFFLFLSSSFHIGLVPLFSLFSRSHSLSLALPIHPWFETYFLSITIKESIPYTVHRPSNHTLQKLFFFLSIHKISLSRVSRIPISADIIFSFTNQCKEGKVITDVPQCLQCSVNE